MESEKAPAPNRAIIIKLRNSPFHRPKCRFLRIALAACAIIASAASNGAGAGVVTNCTEGALRAALAEGGTVTFSCEGKITLTATLLITQDTTVDATGHAVELSGGDVVRVFQVGPGAQLILRHLNVTHGRNPNGAGLFNDGGTVVAD